MSRVSSLLLHGPATLFCTGRLPPASRIAFLPIASSPGNGVTDLGFSSPFLLQFPYGKKWTRAKIRQWPWRALPAVLSPGLQGRKNRGVCWAVSKGEKTLVVRGVVMVNKYLLVVQRLNSSCMDDVSLPLSPEETRLYVRICKRWTKLLFHSRW